MPYIPMLYQLSYRESILRYGLFREEIQDLIDNPDRRVPTHHQVDPRVIEVYLGISTTPTFHIGSQEYSLISRYYREYYPNWLAAVEENNQSIQRRSQGLQAGIDCWRNSTCRRIFTLMTPTLGRITTGAYLLSDARQGYFGMCIGHHLQSTPQQRTSYNCVHIHLRLLSLISKV
jgi:hypothetical protein